MTHYEMTGIGSALLFGMGRGMLSRRMLLIKSPRHRRDDIKLPRDIEYSRRRNIMYREDSDPVF